MMPNNDLDRQPELDAEETGAVRETEAVAEAGAEEPEGEATLAEETGVEGPTAGGAVHEVEELQSELEKARGEAEEYLDGWRRTQAEFANYRRRTDRERTELGAFSQSLLAEKLLPVLDDFERAVDAAGDDSATARGFVLIRDKLTRVLTDAGLERIEAVGAPFDPEVHEALMTQPVEADRAGTVLAELEPGYRFKGRLVRPARVQVGVESEES